ncbi:hypothetical protein BHE74_00000932 [Ensete ventricosum]|nr:hypothetical protein GW17_00016333 [Ensete ventricosum]RWW89973.1 hypothetical protein BHE74_00000932 [Ensete ventricosum]RZR91057.1 hypothetical protein BHM03_00019095 [Ensete ventricosum]
MHGSSGILVSTSCVFKMPNFKSSLGMLTGKDENSKFSLARLKILVAPSCSNCCREGFPVSSGDMMSSSTVGHNSLYLGKESTLPKDSEVCVAGKLSALVPSISARCFLASSYMEN